MACNSGGAPAGRAQQGRPRGEHYQQVQQQQQQQQQQGDRNAASKRAHQACTVNCTGPPCQGPSKRSRQAVQAQQQRQRQQQQQQPGQVLQQRLQEPPVPLHGVACDLPPAPARHEPRPAEPLTPQALAALAQQDAAAHDLHLRLLRFDDQIAELASCRGLLVRFLIRPAGRGGRQGGPSSDALAVDVPEFMTVEYLKRRVARAKLLRGEFLPTSRFLLRKRILGASSGSADNSAASSGSGGGAVPSGSAAASGGGGDGSAGSGSASGASGVAALEDVPACLPNGDEVFLASLGYQAPGPYELYIASALQTTDREQQEQMAELAAQPRQRPHLQPSAAALNGAAAGGGRGMMAGVAAARSAEVQSARLSFLAHLQAPAQPAEPPPLQQQQQQQQQGSAGGSGSETVELMRQQQAGRAAALARAQGRQQAQGSPAVAAHGGAANSLAASASGCWSAAEWQGGAERPRRQMGRWDAEEVAALVEGVQAFGTSWAKIHAAQVQAGRISQHRTQVDLKDKWRNLVKLVARGPAGKQQPRSLELTEEQRQIIWSIAFAPGSSNGDAAPAAEPAT